MFRRKIFYLAGFDPRGARFYHHLLGEEIARANAAGSADLALSAPSRHGGDASWQVTGSVETGDPVNAPPGHDRAITTDCVFLGWDDIVRRHWSRGTALITQAFTAYQGFVARLDWRLLWRAPRGSRIALFYPGVALLAVPLSLAIIAWIGLWMILRISLPAVSKSLGPGLAASLALAGALVIAGLATPPILRHIHALWLLRFVIFNDRLVRAAPTPGSRRLASDLPDKLPDELTARLDHFADAIAAALAPATPHTPETHAPETQAPKTQTYDEVLFITHSNGAILGVPVLTRLLARLGPHLPKHFALVTLGSSIPLIAARRDARWFHAALDALGSADFTWLDLGSLTDGAAAPLVPPCLGRPIERPRGLVQLSPRWFRYADPATYAARRANKYDTHFDYLRRLARPSPLDYLSLTCGARSLAAAIAAFEADHREGHKSEATHG